MGSFDSNSVKDLIASYKGLDIKIQQHTMKDTMVITVKSKHCDLYSRHEVDNFTLRTEDSHYCFRVLNNVINDFMYDLVKTPPKVRYPGYSTHEVFLDELDDYPLPKLNHPKLEKPEKIKNENAGIF